MAPSSSSHGIADSCLALLLSELWLQAPTWIPFVLLLPLASLHQWEGGVTQLSPREVLSTSHVPGARLPALQGPDSVGEAEVEIEKTKWYLLIDT